MHSRKWQVLSRGSVMVIPATGLLLGMATFAYRADGTSPHAVRHVKRRTISSQDSPKLELSVRKGYRFIGNQLVNLYRLAEAEQYVFARERRDNSVERFYWIQFEHFLPSNDRTYNYSSKNTTQIGDAHFVYNVGSWPDSAAEMAGNPASDGAAVTRLLEKQHLSFPHRADARAYVSFAVCRPPKRANDHLRRSFAAEYCCPCSHKRARFRYGIARFSAAP